MKTTLEISIDTEASGPCITEGDVVNFGAVVVEPSLERTFLSPTMLPLFEKYNEGAYRSIGMTREEHNAATATVQEGFMLFNEWIESLNFPGRITMVSDNPAFDWQWINFGFHLTLGRNPLGHSARRIGDMWAGLRGRQNEQSSWKRLRRTKHTHCPRDDAMGNAEAYLKIWEQ